MINIRYGNSLLVVIAILASFTGNSQGKKHNTFYLKGEVPNTTTGTLFLSFEKPSGEILYDSISIINSTFSYSGNIEEPTLAYISDKRGNTPNFTHFYLEPNTLFIYIRNIDSLKNIQIEGSKTEDENKILMEMLKTSKDSSDESWKIAANITKEFIYKHPKSIVSLKSLIFYKVIWPFDTLLALYKTLDPSTLQGRTGRQLTTIIQTIQENSPGYTAKLFTAIDMNGNKFNLKDLRGKYVLLDFWASWCVPCRKENPKLIEIYKKYKEKGFEIVGISVDRKESDWREAIEKDSIALWTQIINNDKTKDSVLLKTLFAVNGYPTKYLIDPKGIIVGRFIGTSDAEKIEIQLSAIFNKRD